MHAYWWWKDIHIDDQCWFVLPDHLRSLYVPHLLYVFKAYYNDPNVEPEPDNRSITDICTEHQEALERYVASQAAKIDT